MQTNNRTCWTSVNTEIKTNTDRGRFSLHWVNPGVILLCSVSKLSLDSASGFSTETYVLGMGDQLPTRAGKSSTYATRKSAN